MASSCRCDPKVGQCKHRSDATRTCTRGVRKGEVIAPCMLHKRHGFIIVLQRSKSRDSSHAMIVSVHTQRTMKFVSFGVKLRVPSIDAHCIKHRKLTNNHLGNTVVRCELLSRNRHQESISSASWSHLFLKSKSSDRHQIISKKYLSAVTRHSA